jgi:hypothetical protein
MFIFISKALILFSSLPCPVHVIFKFFLAGAELIELLSD